MSVYNGPSIATSGLIFDMDVINPKCYAGSGSTVIDLSGNGNNGTLVNSPTYNSANGSFSFNSASSQTCDLGFQWPSNFTLEVILSTSNNAVKQGIVSNYAYNAGGL